MSEFSSRLKEERKRLKLTQKQLIAAVGSNQQSIVNYEKGEQQPGALFLQRIAMLGFDMQYIFTGQRGQMPLTPEEKELLRLYRSASLPGKAAAVAALTAGGIPASPRQSVTIGGDNKGYVAGEGITVYASAKRTRNKRREDI